jgi:hypothetical protein
MRSEARRVTRGYKGYRSTVASGISVFDPFLALSIFSIDRTIGTRNKIQYNRAIGNFLLHSKSKFLPVSPGI